MNSFRITNFRVFDSTGTKVDFSPITILTGPNSSGKSSFVKALVLLKDWLDGIRNEYKKDGSFVPASHPMDFSRTDLKLKGFKGTRNRDATEDTPIIFSLDLDFGEPLGKYTVEFSFVPQEGLLDMGILSSIRILQDDEECFLACQQNGTFQTTIFRGLLKQFILFEILYLIPKNQLETIMENEADVYCSEDRTHIDIRKLYATAESERLFKLQHAFICRKNLPNWDYAFSSEISVKDREKYPTLFGKDMINQLESYAQTRLFFYFPVLDQFKNVDKAESIRILKEDLHTCKSLYYFGNRSAPYIDEVISAFAASNHTSFISFYEEQENEFFREFSQPMKVIATGKSENFIDSDILHGINLEYNSTGLFIRNKSLFHKIYMALNYWQWAEDENSDNERLAKNDETEYVIFDKDSELLYRGVSPYAGDFNSGHWLYKAYSEFVSYIMSMVMMPDYLSRMVYFSDSFTSIKRLYSFEDTSLMVSTIKSYLNVRDKYNTLRKDTWHNISRSDYSPGDFISKWLKVFGIGEELVVRVDEEGLGFKLYIKKNDYEEALADMGHGVSQLVSLLLLTETSILDSKIRVSLKKEQIDGNQPYDNIPPAILAIEEPEVSMHPNYQSKLASLFEDAVQNYHVDIRFIVETHSEYLVRKTQAIVSGYNSEQYNRNPFAVNYFTSEGEAYLLGYEKSGRFNRPFGDGFFDESARLNYQVLKKEQELSNN